MDLNILLIDDSETSMAGAKSVLSTISGVSIRCASDGMEGLAAAAKHRPDLVFVDSLMPRLSGLAFCQAMKSSPEHAQTKVIMLTGRHSEFEQALARLAGADGHLAKPFKRQQLDETLTQLGYQ